MLSDGDPEHLLKFHGVCLWEGRLTLVTELMKVSLQLRPLRQSQTIPHAVVIQTALAWNDDVIHD